MKGHTATDSKDRTTKNVYIVDSVGKTGRQNVLKPKLTWGNLHVAPVLLQGPSLLYSF